MKKITPFMMKYVSNRNVIYSNVSVLRCKVYKKYKNTLHHCSNLFFNTLSLNDNSLNIDEEYSELMLRIRYRRHKNLTDTRSTRLKTLKTVLAKPDIQSK